MPDVKVWLRQGRVPPLETLERWHFEDRLAHSVAHNLSCEVFDPEKGKHVFHEIDPVKEVDLTELSFAAGRGADVRLEVAAFDYPDRMETLSDRMAVIGNEVKKFLGLPSDSALTWTFIPIQEGHWGKV